jgi:hypothetical protein
MLSVCGLSGRARRGLGRLIWQLGVAAVRRGEEQEDQDDDQDVDQRDEVDVDLFPLASAAEIHARRSPWHDLDELDRLAFHLDHQDVDAVAEVAVEDPAGMATPMPKSVL